MDVDRIAEQLTQSVRGGRFIVVVDAAVAGAALAKRLGDRGAEAVKLVAASKGTGDMPDDIDTVWIDVPRQTTATDSIHALGAVIGDPPAWLLDELDRFDPDRSAQVLSAPFLSRPEMLGRGVVGGRRPEWEKLEDKTTVDVLWDDAGVAREPSQVVDVAAAAAVARDLRSDLGTVWSADNSRGWHGAGDRTRWVQTPDDARSAVGFFSAQVPTVRVMPFLDGIPCSIHGVVTERGVAVGRPVEIVILRSPSSRSFVYAGVSNTWDPPEQVREQMRDAARRVGALLARTVGYRGAFGIDGVCTAVGFRPNELNTRMTAGFAILTQSMEGFPLADVVRGVVSGTVDIDPGELEDFVVDHADRNRIGGFGFPNVVETAPEEVSFRYERQRVVEVDDPDGPREGWMEIGPAPVGSYLRVRLEDDAIEPGSSIGPLAVAALRFAAARWGLEVPDDVEPAPDLFRTAGG